MIQLAPGEKVLWVMRRHWIVFLGPLVMFFILLTVPPIGISLAPRYLPNALRGEMFGALATFLLALYTMGLLTYLLVIWIAYYLDIWVITDHRLIDVEQHGLFHREISEIPMERVQNVTIEIPGFVATVLKFGNIRIQTAGHGEFTISEVPDCYQAKDLILKYSRTPRPMLPPSPGL
ncbi:MAG: PH domain-containing protein [Patescibacteria group bacterium]